MIKVGRTKDGGKTIYYEKYWSIPLWNGLHIYRGTLKWYKLGISFYYKGDEITWIWPWKRKTRKHKWLSLLWSGNGDFGDAIFPSLKDIDLL